MADFFFALDKNGHPIQIPNLLAPQKVTIGASSAASEAVTSGAIRLSPTVDCYVAIGADPTADTDSHFMFGGMSQDIQVSVGDKIAVLQVSSGGTMYISELS